jgi:hypothetical protein
MSRRIVGLVVVALLCVVSSAFAQASATILGTVVDEQKGVLPGVTITATDLETGRQFVGVTNERGEYRLERLSPGTYRVQAELAGFATIVNPKLELLVGQNATVPFTLRVAGLEETVTVTSEAPLVDISSSQIAGNVDRRQMEELPIQGRNWMELSMLVKGITANNVDTRPGVGRDDSFQLNIDGQQITQQTASSGFGQPKFSREAIAEFQIVTNLFDVTQGRSAGIQVQAITRSGTNTTTGSAYGYFRDDKFNAADPVANRVLPFQNQQVGGAVGGPIRRDRLHYFVSYEYERSPRPIFTQPAVLPNQSWQFETKERQNSVMGRVDAVISDKSHLTLRSSYWDFENPFDASSTAHPSQTPRRTRQSGNVLANWSRVLNPDMVQEIKLGYNNFNWANLLAVPEMASTWNYVFPSLTIGGARNFPQRFSQHLGSGRYDLSWHRTSHSFKIGAEFIYWRDDGEWHLGERGEFFFSSRPADMDRRFPRDAWNNPAAWDVSGLDATILRFDQSVGNWNVDIPRPTIAIWLGDTWRITDRFTLNYGVRWDDDFGATDPPDVTNFTEFAPFGGPLFKTGIKDHNNVAPRVGFVWNVMGTNDFVIRGGSGHFYSIPVSNVTFSQQSFGNRIKFNSFQNDGQPGFIFNPTRGFTQDQILSGASAPQFARVIAHDYVMPYTWQSSIGFQKQLGPVMAVEADLTHWRLNNAVRGRDPNLFFNPDTGYNFHPNPANRVCPPLGATPTVLCRPDQRWSEVFWMESSGWANYAGLSTALTRRLQNNFQGGITYTVMFLKKETPDSFFPSHNNQFNLDDDYARAADFQRNTLRLHGLYRLPWGIAVSGVYFYGSGNYFGTTVSGVPFGVTQGVNRFNAGAPITVPAAALGRFDGPSVIGTGETVPRNALRGKPLHKLDFRATKDVALAGSVRISGIVEVFNLLNHDNFGSYNGVVNTATFGDPRQSSGNAYTPRSAQFGFRLSY